MKGRTSLSDPHLLDSDKGDARFVIGCAHREVNNRNPSFDYSQRREPSAFVQHLFEQGKIFEAEIFEKLERLHKVSSLRNTNDDVGSATIRAMDRGDRVIIGPTLPTINHRSGRPDVLLRFGKNKMSNGNWAYLPVDVKNSKALTDGGKQQWCVSTLEIPWFEEGADTDIGLGKPEIEHSLQLAHYWLMLLDHHRAPNGPPVGGIIDNEMRLIWRNLDNGEDNDSPLKIVKREWNQRWNAIIALRNDLEACTRPVYKTECGSCIWHDICETELEVERHVSLLPGVNLIHVAKLQEAGITTTPQLAALDPRTAIAAYEWRLTPPLSELFNIAFANSVTDLSSLPKMTKKRMEKLESLGVQSISDLLSLHQPTLKVPQYKALSDNIDMARIDMRGGEYPFYARGQNAPLIPRADIEIDFDIENDDIIYLFGVYITRKQPDGSYDNGEYTSFHFFNREDLEEEGRQFAAFWTWLQQILNETTSAGKTANIYCYSGKIAELPRMREASSRNSNIEGVPTIEEINDLGTASHWIDMYEISKQLLWPTRSKSLKDLAKLGGFKWHTSDAGGGNSMAWYQVAAGITPGDASENQAKLLEYNQDDVMATLSLRNWLSDGVAGKGWTLESVETLDL